MTVNLYTANQSSWETDTTGAFPGATVTATRDATQAQFGSASLKVVTTGGSDTFEQIEVHISSGNFIPGQQYTFSLYAKVASGTANLRHYCQGSGGAVGSVNNITVTTTWTRFSFTVTMPTPITDTYDGVRLDTGGTPQAITLWIDGLQCEQGSSASTWVLGTGTPNNVNVETVAKFLTNVALAEQARAKFLIAAALNIRLLERFIIFLRDPKPIFAWFKAVNHILAAFVRGSEMIGPTSSIDVIAYVSGPSGLITNLTSASCQVTFPDNTQTTYVLGGGIVNNGDGSYTLTYTTKGVGTNSEVWTFGAADGSVGEFRTFTEVAL
jgi:hypothetical protein